MITLHDGIYEVLKAVGAPDEKARVVAVSFPPSEQISTKADLVCFGSVPKTDLAQMETRLSMSLIAAVGVILVGIGIATGDYLGLNIGL